MGEPYLGELRIISFNFPPRGWALCNGQLLPINQNQALFSILGTTYGGDGQTTFSLPNLQGRVPIGAGQSGGSPHDLGETGGEYAHTLTMQELPTHSHGAPPASSVRAGTDAPLNAVWASNVSMYAGAAPNTAMSSLAVTSVGGSQPHTNVQPYLVVNVVIALQGIFPSRN